MENYKLQYRDGMQIRITNACIKSNQYDENRRLIAMWRNFSGLPTKFNKQGGKRTFTIDLNRKGNANLPFLIEFGNDAIGWKPVTVQELIDMGWIIDVYDGRIAHPEREYKEDYVPSANIDVVVSEHDPKDSWRDPKIFQYVGDTRFKMVFHPNSMNQDEQPIEALDNLWFDRVQVRLNHSEYNKAYLESMHIYPRIQSVSYDDWAR